jgi:ketosteroid isomerase-like protein
MSKENVELVRRLTDAFNRRDLDGMLKLWTPDAVLDWSNARSFDAGVYRGHGEIQALMEGFSRRGTKFESRSSMAR